LNSDEVKVLIGTSSFAQLDAAPLNRLQQAGCCVIDNPFKRRLTKPELLELLGDDVVGLIAGLEPLDREVMTASSLKVISRCGSGMSNVDLAAAEELNIKVCNTPYGPTTSVAEVTVGALLSLLRMLPIMDRSVHERKWEKRIGRQLEGKKVVIIGFGRIGRKVGKLLRAFEADVSAVDPEHSGIIDGTPIVSLDTALKTADVIILHSSGEDTLLGKREFGLMKRGVYILNAARGGLIDEAELFVALKEKRVAGAWLDTFGTEPYDGCLCDLEEVILTPHIGSYTKECRLSMEMEAVENLLEAFASLKMEGS